MAHLTIRLFHRHLNKSELNEEELIQIYVKKRKEEFENRFAEYSEVKHAIGVNSATAALDLAMKLLHVNHGDEVIVPTMTFVSTGHVVAYNLATPVFADIDEETKVLSLGDVEAKLFACAGGFRDHTRIAAGDAGLWTEVCKQNAPAVLAAIQAHESELAALGYLVSRTLGSQTSHQPISRS